MHQTQTTGKEIIVSENIDFNTELIVPNDRDKAQIFSNPLTNTLCLGKKEIEEMTMKHLNHILNLGYYTEGEVADIRRLRRNLKCKSYVKKSRDSQHKLEIDMEKEVRKLEDVKFKLVEQKCALQREIKFYQTSIN